MKRRQLFLALLPLLLITACRPGTEGEAAATPTAVPAPTSSEAVTGPTPEPAAPFPFLAAENERWQVYVDHYEKSEMDALLEFSVYDKDGKLVQALSMTSPYLYSYGGALFENDSLITFRDLNFDGLPDLAVLYENVRNGAYDAFLWNGEAGQFAEEPSFTGITGPCNVNEEELLVFSCGSSGASHAGWSVHRYIPGEGYRLEYTLDVFSPDDPYTPGLYIETRYENGQAADTLETYDPNDLCDIWDKCTAPF